MAYILSLCSKNKWQPFWAEVTKYLKGIKIIFVWLCLSLSSNQFVDELLQRVELYTYPTFLFFFLSVLSFGSSMLNSKLNTGFIATGAGLG